MSPERRGSRRRRTFALVITTTILLLVAGLAAFMGANTGSRVTGPPQTAALTVEESVALERAYAPSLHFSSGERAFPVAVDYFIARSVLMSGLGSVIDEHPTPEGLGQVIGSGLYLDDVDGGAQDSLILKRYEQDRPGLVTTLYVHVAETGDRILLQYWLFYVFNQGTYNSHEGDWEMVQVTLDSVSRSPLSITLSVHHRSARVTWDRVLKEGPDLTSPAVFVAAGSHANYFSATSDLFALGDNVDGLGPVYGPQAYALVTIGRGSDPATFPPWLYFQGDWGEPGGPFGSLMGSSGPPGPMFREGGALWEGSG